MSLNLAFLPLAFINVIFPFTFRSTNIFSLMKYKKKRKIRTHKFYKNITISMHLVFPPFSLVNITFKFTLSPIHLYPYENKELYSRIIFTHDFIEYIPYPCIFPSTSVPLYKLPSSKYFFSIF